MQENLKTEKFKKIFIMLITLALFGVSYYYYVYKSDKNSVVKQRSLPKQTQIAKPEKKLKKITKKQETKLPIQQKESEKKSENNEIVESKTNKFFVNKKKKIKPTNKSDLISTALNSSGKNDPFSYIESNFIPFISSQNRSSGRGFSKGSRLPVPPKISNNSSKPGKYVTIKGFLGNKVIVDVNGLTESLEINQSLRGIKVLSIDSVNLTCDFKINGKKVVKKMKPITKPDKNVEIKYLHN